MSDETIVAIYDTPAHAELAAADLRTAGVPESAISIHSDRIGAATTGITNAGMTATTAPREQGFWSSLFGGSPDHDTSVYERSVDNGASVLSVKVPDAHVDRVMAIIESHNPIDIDERATTLGIQNSPMTTATTATMLNASPAPAPTPAVSALKPTTPAGRDTDGMIQLSEESLTVGKRVVNRGGTRIRRFVVETPVEETVSLHSENVVLDRHPVTDGRPVADSFSNKSIEMMETVEEAIVSKVAHVYEEVGLRKEASDRVEKVRDTVRKEEVEIERIPGSVNVAKNGSPVPAIPKQ